VAVPVTARLFILSLYPAVQLVWLAVVGMLYPLCRLRASVPDSVIGVPDTLKPVGTVIATLVTVPVALLLPAPIAVLKSAALNALTLLSAFSRKNDIAEGLVSVKSACPAVVPPIAVLNVLAVKAVTVLSALKRGNVIAEGLVSVNMLCPMVVPPKLLRPVAAFNSVAPPSHFKRSVYAVFQLVEAFAIVALKIPVELAVTMRVPEPARFENVFVPAVVNWFAAQLIELKFEFPA
jgi:hypothetical protein